LFKIIVPSAGETAGSFKESGELPGAIVHCELPGPISAGDKIVGGEAQLRGQ
jgi:hypothetical protein